MSRVRAGTPTTAIIAVVLLSCSDREVVAPPHSPRFAPGPPGGFAVVVVSSRSSANQRAQGVLVANLVDAVSRVRAGGTIIVEAGEWATDGVVIDKPLTMTAWLGPQPVLVNGGTGPGLTIDGVPAGTVELRGLRFVNAAGESAIRARGTYDRVVLRDSYVEVTVEPAGSGTAYGVNATESTVPGGHLVVENSVFVGGRFGVIGQTATIHVRGSRFTNHTVAGVQHSFGSRGTVQENEFDGCGANACIAAHEPPGVLIANNRIRHPLGTARNGIIVFATASGPHTVSITGNEVIGTGVQPDDLDPLDRRLLIDASALRAGIRVRDGVAATVQGNRVSGAHWGIIFDGGATGRGAWGRIADNVVADCGWLCISSFEPLAPTLIVHNLVTGDVGFRRALTAFFGRRSPNAAAITIRDNTAVGNRNGGDPADPMSYAFRIGIQAISWDPFAAQPGPIATGLPIEAYGNTVSHVGAALLSVEGGSLRAHDNVLNGAARGVAANGALSVMQANRNDILDAAIGAEGDGAMDARCNWWGSTSGPSNPAVPASVYIPFATVPIANQSAVPCG